MKKDPLSALLGRLPEMRQVRANMAARSEPRVEASIVAELFKYQGVGVIESRGEWVLIAFWDHRTGERKQGWARSWYLLRGPQPRI